MSEPVTSSAEADRPNSRLQFSLQTFIGLFVIVALLLGYLRSFGVESITKCIAVTAAGLVVGAVIGGRMGKLADAMFWAAIGAVFGYLTILGDASYHWSLQYAWPLAGALAGARAGAFSEGSRARRMLECAVPVVTFIFMWLVFAAGFQIAMIADLACATLGGALMAVAVELAGRFERHTGLPRHLLATAFVVVGITAHWLAFHYAKNVYWWVQS